MVKILGGIIVLTLITAAASTYFFETRGYSLPALAVLAGMNAHALDDVVLKNYKDRMAPLTYQKLINDPYTITYELANIDQDSSQDVIATIHADSTCGSGGCVVSILLQKAKGTYTPIEFEYAVHDLTLLDSYTNGMRDLQINGDTGHRLAWDGNRYQLETVD